MEGTKKCKVIITGYHASNQGSKCIVGAERQEVKRPHRRYLEQPSPWGKVRAGTPSGGSLTPAVMDLLIAKPRYIASS